MDIEYLRRSGKLPPRYYYQLNHKSAAENYIEQRQQREQQLHQEILLRQYAQEEVEKNLDEAVYKALNDILGDFKEL